MQRLDVFLVKKGYFSSRERAKDAILEGEVFVDGKRAKASIKVSGEEEISLGEVLKYVSRGALKLKKALEVFGISLKGKTVLDIGSSTGGFTEVSIENGAKKVIAVDVGSDQMDERLRKDNKVVLYENTDFREIDSKKLEGVDFIVSDVSFISLKMIFPKIIEVFGNEFEGIFLFKPQFECGKEIAKKFKGVIQSEKIHRELLQEFLEYLKGFGLKISDLNFSPVKGKSGNIEYLIYIGKSAKFYDVNKIVETAFTSLKS